MTDAILSGWQARIRAAAATRTPLSIHGGGTKAFLGGALRGEPFNTRDYAGIVEYEPTELVSLTRARVRGGPI